MHALSSYTSFTHQTTLLNGKQPARRKANLLITASALPSSEQKWQRRTLAALIASLPIALPASRALALIPDDDDEELVEKARANRKSRLASERQAEKVFSRAEGYADRSEKKEIIAVQRAVNSLALTGKQLASGDVSAAASTLSGGWVSDLSGVVSDLSLDGGAKAAGSRVISQIKDLQNTAKKGSLSDAKAGYVNVVGSFSEWTTAAGISDVLKGL